MGFSPHESQSQTEVSDAEVDELMSKYGGEGEDGPTVLADEAESESQSASSEETETSDEVANAPQAAAASEQKLSAKKTDQPQDQSHTQGQQQHLQEFEIPGTGIKAPLSKILQWASQGRDYAQKMSELKTHREQLSGLESQYKPIDEWVKANPDKWEKLQKVIEAEKQGYGDIPPDHPILQKLSKFESVINRIENERQSAQLKQEDDALGTEIQSIREKYKDLDWASLDESGRSATETKVLRHAVENGFKTFKAAFLDLYHEDLFESAETRGREQLAASKEKQAKSGLLPKNGAPEKPALSKPNKHTKSYPDTADVLKEYGIGS